MKRTQRARAYSPERLGRFIESAEGERSKSTSPPKRASSNAMRDGPRGNNGKKDNNSAPQGNNRSQAEITWGQAKTQARRSARAGGDTSLLPGTRHVGSLGQPDRAGPASTAHALPHAASNTAHANSPTSPPPPPPTLTPWGAHPADPNLPKPPTHTPAQLADLADTRKRALLRLIDKRRQLHRSEVLSHESERQRDNRFRDQWRRGYKEKRERQLAYVADRAILQDTLSAHAGSAEALGRLAGADAWGALLAEQRADHLSSRGLGDPDSLAEAAADIYADLASPPGSSKTHLGRHPTQALPGLPPKLTAAQEFLRKTMPMPMPIALSAGDGGQGSRQMQEEAAGGRLRGGNAYVRDDGDHFDDDGQRERWENGFGGLGETGVTDVMFAQAALCETLFLVGPSPEDITGLVDAAARRAGTAKSAVTLLHRPSLLFVTNKDPSMDWGTLESFCFPEGVSVTATAPGRALARRGNPARIKRRFVFTLTNHVGMESHGSRYGVCLVVPRTFRDTDTGRV